MGREQLAGCGQDIYAEIFGTTDDPTLAQRLHGLAIPAAAHFSEASHTADRLFALGWTAAQKQVGDPLLSDDVADVVAVDHDGHEIEVQLLRDRDAIECLNEIRLHFLAEGLQYLYYTPTLRESGKKSLPTAVEAILLH
jgi:hypothetical protein